MRIRLFVAAHDWMLARWTSPSGHKIHFASMHLKSRSATTSTTSPNHDDVMRLLRLISVARKKTLDFFSRETEIKQKNANYNSQHADDTFSS